MCGLLKKLEARAAASELVRKLVAPTAPTATDLRSAHWPVGMQCSELGVVSVASDVAECISIVPVEERPRFQLLPLTTVTLNERDDLLQEAAGAPILVSKCDRDRWIGAAIVPTKGADEYAVAELKNDVIGSGVTQVLVSSHNEPATLALKQSAATALKLAGVSVKMEESALYDSQSNGLAESAVKDAKDAVRTDLACLVRRFGQGFPGRHPVLTWLVKYSVAMVNRCRRGPDGKTANELRKFARALTHFAEKFLFMAPEVTKGVARVEPRWEGGIFHGVSDRSERPQNELTSRS